MATDQPASFIFTKLVVDDLDAMAHYYSSVFGLYRGSRDQFDDGIGAEPIDEIALVAKAGDSFGGRSLLEFIDRPAARHYELILGFTTPDLSALLDRVKRAGCTVFGRVKEMPDYGIRVAFARDPEGHLAELVEVRA